MPTSEEQWIEAQSWIGTAEPRDTFDERFDRKGSLNSAILESLRAQYSALAGQPGSLSLPSGLSVSIGENLRAFQAMLKDFMNNTPGEGEDEPITVRHRKRYRPDLR